MNKSNCHLINQKWFYRDFDKQLNKIHPKLFLYPKVNHPHGLFDKMESQSTKHLRSLPLTAEMVFLFSFHLHSTQTPSCRLYTALIMLSTLSSKTFKISSPQGRVSSASEILCGHQQHLTPKMELNPLDLFPPFPENNSRAQDSLLLLALDTCASVQT